MKQITKIFAIVFVAAVVVFVCFQVVRYASTPYKTETALSYTTAATVNATGIAVRQEAVIDTDKENVVGYLYDDGAKVASGSLVTEIYASQDALSKKARIEELEDEISMLQDAQATGLVYLANTEALVDQISARTYTLIDRGYAGDLTDCAQDRLSFLSLLNKKQIATNRETDFAARISVLQQQVEQLKASMPAPLREVYMPATGYFSSATDGYEAEYSPQMLRDCSVEEIQQLINGSSARHSNAVGKVITEFNWYFAIVVSCEQAELLQNSGSATAAFPALNLEKIPMTFDRVIRKKDSNPNDKQELAAVLLKCNYMDAPLSAMRVQNVQLALRSYTGLRVSRAAIRFLDGQKGVYVRIGQTLRFKPFGENVVYEGDDFLLVRASEKDDQLQLYDEIVVEGMGLYDGKTI